MVAGGRERAALSTRQSRKLRSPTRPTGASALSPCDVAWDAVPHQLWSDKTAVNHRCIARCRRTRDHASARVCTRADAGLPSKRCLCAHSLMHGHVHGQTRTRTRTTPYARACARRRRPARYLWSGRCRLSARRRGQARCWRPALHCRWADV